jgi:hypothetical protein
MMFAIGNDELDKAEALGDSILCDRCGKEHPIEYAKEVMPDGTKRESKRLAFYTCGDDSYLAGINGKRI